MKSFGPAGTMIILIIDMFIKIRAQKRTIVAQTEVIIVHDLSRRNKRIHNQMIILMLTNVIIFFATTLPLTFNKLLASYTISGINELQQFLITSSVFNWILSLNFAVGFFNILLIYEISFDYYSRSLSTSIVLHQIYFERNFFIYSIFVVIKIILDEL